MDRKEYDARIETLREVQVALSEIEHKYFQRFVNKFHNEEQDDDEEEVERYPDE